MKRKFIFSRIFVLSLMLLAVGLAQAGDPQRGRQIYIDKCSGCHGLTGFPTMPDVPAFGRGEGVMKPNQELMAFIKRGKVVMPGFEGLMTDIEILDTIAYIRTLF